MTTLHLFALAAPLVGAPALDAYLDHYLDRFAFLDG